MRMLSSICVFCGSKRGAREEYAAATEALARYFCAKKITLIYGGASCGLMGLIADTMLANGGSVIGVIPESLVEYEIAHRNLTELHVVASLHQRKEKMFSLSDAFVGLPGGVGTLDEMFEIIAWAVLGVHVKPCGVLNIAGYFDKLAAFLEHVHTEGFMSAQDRQILISKSSPEELLQAFSEYQAPPARWTGNAKSVRS